MSFFGGLVGAVKGLVVGYVTSGFNPAGAVAGAVSGAISGSSGHSASQGGLDYIQPTTQMQADPYWQGRYGGAAGALGQLAGAYAQHRWGTNTPAAAGVATVPIRQTARGSHLCKCRPMRRTTRRQARMASGRGRAPSVYGGRRFIQPFQPNGGRVY